MVAANIRSSTVDQSSEFLLVVANKNLPKVGHLLISGVDVNVKEKKTYRTALHIAAIRCKGDSHFAVMEILLNNGAYVNAQDNSGKTAIHYLVQSNEKSMKVIELLLKFKADVNLKDYSNEIPLFCAIKERNVEIVRILLEYGTDTKIRDHQGLTPLLQISLPQPQPLAVLYNYYNEKDLRIIELLLQHGAEVNAKDGGGETALCKIVQPYDKCHSNFAVIKLLLEHNADVTVEMKSRQTMLKNMFGYDIRLVKTFVDGELRFTGYKYDWEKDIDGWHKRSEKYKTLECLIRNGSKFSVHDSAKCIPVYIFLKGMSSLSADRDIPDELLTQRLGFLLKHVDINVLDGNGLNVLSVEHNFSRRVKRIILKHVAKLHFLDSKGVHPKITETISKDPELNGLYPRYIEELKLAKETKLKDCWVTFFHLLTDSRKKLKNYAGNRNLTEDFRRTDVLKKFPVYGALMNKRMTKAMKTRTMFDESSIVLSELCPIFGPSHLIIKDTFDCLSLKDYELYLSSEV